ncbi:MAG: AAA family ATPase, partial [Cyanobacteria bacterium SZAS TMP-1]|nr:AAA family ATPase [Cyanobacteria bacterium SZAS TMP-1]
ILFILGGAFVRLGEIVARRLSSTETSIGFGATVKAKETKFSHYQKDATAEDFVKFGMIPEFIGRIPKRLTIEALTVDQLERILVEPKKALVMQKHLLLSATTDLRFTKGALRAIAEEAHKSGTHGRALREIVEVVLEPIVFEEPKVAIVTAEMVMNRNAELNSQNQRDAAQKAATNCPFVCADDEVDTVREEAEAAVASRTAPRRDRSTALTVRR